MINTHGYAALNSKDDLVPFSFQRRELREHDVLIDIKYCGICHSDIHQARDEWGGSKFPMVPGHEIAGVVARTGSQVTKFKVGETVGVGCIVDSCRTCVQCDRGLQQFCEQGMTGTYNDYEGDGKTVTQGGYADKIVVDENYVLRIPASLSLAAAAPLLCAGITLYSPLKHWKAGPGKKVAVVGLGGLGHMGVKLGRALGAEITVLSQSENKREDAHKLGAHHFHSTRSPEIFRRLRGSFDLILNTVSAPIDWNRYLDLLKVEGTMVLVGLPEKAIPLSAFSLILGRRSLAGSLIGGIAETQEMLDFCGQHQVESDIEMLPIQRVNEAYQRVLKSDVRYRFVIDLASLH